MSAKTLLDITDDLHALWALIEEREGDITGIEQAIDGWLAEIDGDLAGKLDNYAALITHMEHLSEGRKEQAQRLSKRAKTDENAAAYLRHRLKFALEARGKLKLDTPRFRLSIQRNGGAAPVIIPDLQALPPQFVKQEIVYVPDREAIRKALESGQQVPGATLGERGTRVSIR